MFLFILSLLYLFQPIVCTRPPPDPTFLNASITSQSLFQVEQITPFYSCDLRVDRYALYVCARQVYVFADDTPDGFFSSVLISQNSVLGADMDNNGLIIVESSNIAVWIDLRPIDHIFFHRDFPLLYKVKSKGSYLLIATVMESKAITQESPSTSRDFVYEKMDSDSFEEKTHKKNYYVSSFLRGSVPSSYKTRFPNEPLDFQLNENSFKKGVIFSDPLHGNDYFIVGLERGWIMVFKSVFQNAQMDYNSAERIEEEFEIIDMTVNDSYLFALLGKRLKRYLKVVIYKLTTLNGFELREECTLYLSQHSLIGYVPQLRVKLFDGVFTLMVNFPGEHIVVYHFRKPASGVLPVQCRKESGIITYSDAIEDTKIGYSFDYVTKTTQKDFAEHRIVLSPILIGSKNIYYIPYCMPNTYRDPAKGCIPCTQGFSLGGFKSVCLECNSTFNSIHYLQKSDVIEINCPVSCNVSERFGKHCLSCPKYMESIRAVLPAEGEWQVNSKGECGFDCRIGSKHEILGGCLSSEEITTMIDQCSRIKDCMNCTMSQTCAWTGTTCTQASWSPVKKSFKPSLVDDVLNPAVKCERVESYQLEEYRNSLGVIRLSAGPLDKNQVFRWDLRPLQGHNRIELKITADGSQLDNLPTLYIQFPKENYAVRKISLARGTVLVNLVADELVLFAHMEQGVYKKGELMRIEYTIRPINELLEGLLFLFKWLYYMVFACMGITFALSIVQKLGSWVRRRRLFWVLQQMIDIEEIDVIEETIEPVDLEKVMKDEKIVCRVVHDENKLNKFDQTECSICLEQFKNGEVLAEFSCNHVFHVNCFESWVKLATSQAHIKCPVCNKILV